MPVEVVVYTPEAPDVVTLFVRRARAAGYPVTGDDLPVAVEVCRLVGGTPMAAELAAARLDRWTPAQLAEHLAGHLPPGADPLRATVDWSVALLSPPDRELFVRLAVFGGPCTAEEVAAVLSLDAVRVAARLAALADKHLLVRLPGAGPRYVLPEPVRAAAREGLAADAAAPGYRGRAELHALLADADEALDRADTGAARDLLAEAARRARELADGAGEALVLHRLGGVDLFDGRPADAARHLAAALARRHALGHAVDVVDSLEWLATAVQDPALTAELLGAAEVLRDRHGLPVPAQAVRTRSAAVDGARSELGERGYARAVAAGRTAEVPDLADRADRADRAVSPAR